MHRIDGNNFHGLSLSSECWVVLTHLDSISWELFTVRRCQMSYTNKTCYCSSFLRAFVWRREQTISRPSEGFGTKYEVNQPYHPMSLTALFKVHTIRSLQPNLCLLSVQMFHGGIPRRRTRGSIDLETHNGCILRIRENGLAWLT